MKFKVWSRNFQALIKLQSGHTYSVLFVQVFDIKQSYMSWSYYDIFIQNIYINICDIKQTYKQLITTKGKKFLTGRRISYRLCLWAWPGSNIFKNFFNKKFLDLSLEYSFNSAGHSENIDFLGPCLTKPVGQNHFKESIGSPKITVR